MTMPKTSVHSIDLDNLEREMRRIAVSRRSVGRAKLPRIVGRPASVAPFDSSIRHEKDEPPTENGPALEAAIPQGLDSGSFGSIPHTPSAAVPRPPPERRGNPSSRALALVVLSSSRWRRRRRFDDARRTNGRAGSQNDNNEGSSILAASCSRRRSDALPN
jgi:hypothetical protein